MIISLSKEELALYVCGQLNTFYLDNKPVKKEHIMQNGILDLALSRTEYCFSKISVRGYTENGNARFNHLHSDQYSQFLYYLSNTNWKEEGDTTISDKLVLLNRALHGIWFSYKGKLPDIFYLMHPLGTILGNADYSDYLVVMQNVTVNTGVEKNGKATPHLGKYLCLCAGAKIIGNEKIGDRVTLGVNACVYKQEIPDDSLVFVDNDGKQHIKSAKVCNVVNYFV